GDKTSFTSAERKGSYKCARRPDFKDKKRKYLETGRPDSTSGKQSRDHKKLIRISKDSIDSIK
ncbi:22581_t:CDS:1, partial [Gigaspora rosea]